jgi:two-component system sensor histidine kinase CpxA
MRARVPLLARVLGLAFLNLGLLGLGFVLFARLQFRLDAGSFLLAPAESRIMAMAHALALELDEAPVSEWNEVLRRNGAAHGVVCYLLDEEGAPVAGPAWKPPPELAERVPRRERPPRRADEPPRAPQPVRVRTPRAPAPPLFLASTSHPTRYWAGARIPLRQDRNENPKPGTLVLMSESLVGSPLFFDPKPWLVGMLGVVVISVLCWLPFIRGVTRSIGLMTRAAGQIAEGRFDVQVEQRRRDEIGQLGEAVNRMAARLAGYVNGQKRFLGGIAHELCTPIATIQFGLGSLERRVSGAELERVNEIQEEVEHMSALVNELLSFTRAGMAGVEVRLQPVELAAVVARALEREAPAGHLVETAVDAGLSGLAEPEYLFRAVSNLVRNAIRYAGHAGPIRIAAHAAGGRVFLTVADQGPGVPGEALDEIFAPFYRLDDSRDQATGGVGLGLAIVKTCVEACQGVVRCRNRQPSGLEVEIELAEAPSVRVR